MKYYINRTNPTLGGIDSIFNDIFGDNFYSSRIPSVDVYETPSSYVVEAEVAGYDENDISISVEKHVLTVASDGQEHEESQRGGGEEREEGGEEVSHERDLKAIILQVLHTS